MSTPDGGKVYDLAALLLAVVVDGFADDGVALPVRQCVSPGILPAWDCDQLTVHVVRISHGIPGADDDRPLVQCPPLRHATFRVELVREVPGIEGTDPPSTADLDKSARQMLDDLDRLDRTVRAASRLLAGAGDVARGMGVPVYIGVSTPIGAEGGYAASRLEVGIPLDM